MAPINLELLKPIQHPRDERRITPNREPKRAENANSEQNDRAHLDDPEHKDAEGR